MSDEEKRPAPDHRRPGLVDRYREALKRNRSVDAHPAVKVLRDEAAAEGRTPEERASLERQRVAMAALVSLTNAERGLVLCWFCETCSRYVGLGDACHCDDDD